MSGGIVIVKFMGGPLDNSKHQYLAKEIWKTKRLEVKSMGIIHNYTVSHKYDDELWDAVYNAPKENIIGRQDGIGGFGGNRLDY